MRVAVVGVGAVGGYFGGRLAQAGIDVVFVARGEAARRLRTDGLKVSSVQGTFAIPKPAVMDDPSSADPVDVVFIAVKAPQVVDAGRWVAPLVGPETAVIPLQNGVEAPSLLADVFGTDRVLGGLCRILASRTADGKIQHAGLEPTIVFGELTPGGTGGVLSDRVQAIRAAFESTSGMTVATSRDIAAAMWKKFLFIAPLGGVGALVREPAGVLREVPETRWILRAAMEEVVAVGQRRDVAIDSSAVDQAMGVVDTLPPYATASMQRDISAGRPSELEFQTGTVVRYGRDSDVPTPVNSVIYGALLPSERRASGKPTD